MRWTGCLLVGALVACGSDPSPGAPVGTGGGAGQGAAGAPSGGQAGLGGSAAGATSAGGKAGAGGQDPCALWTAPAGHNLDDTLPDLTVERLTASGEEATSLAALRTACEQPSLLVLRVEPAWCGPCGQRADRTASVLAPFLAPGTGVRVVTLLYAGPDNARPRAEDLVAWREQHPELPGELVRSTAGDAGEALVRGHGVLPLIYLVDARTMRISNVLENPSEDFFAAQVADSLAGAGGPVVAPPPAVDEEMIDDRFAPFEWELISQMAAPVIPLPSPSNAYADDPDAASLGESLFIDTSLAGDAGVACATCHIKDKGWADGRPTAQGTALGTFNTPSALFTGSSRWFFWDGRADSAWSQALGPLENPLETGGTRLHVAHRVASTHRAGYEAVFGALPPLDDLARFPPAGKPGDAAYDTMTADDREAVTRVFVNVGKALEAFERTLTPTPGRFEAYAAGSFEALSPLERDGLGFFLHSGCPSCHHGPTLSDGAFHDIHMPASSGSGDRGRLDGVSALLASPFRMDGPYSDDPVAGQARLAGLAPHDEMLGQIKTPSLRNLSRTGPWGHGGTFVDLPSLVKHYGQLVPFGKANERTVGVSDPAIPGFAVSHNAALTAFLLALGAP